MRQVYIEDGEVETVPDTWTCVDCEEEYDEAQEHFDQPHGRVCWECWDVRYRRNF